MDRYYRHMNIHAKEGVGHRRLYEELSESVNLGEIDKMLRKFGWKEYKDVYTFDMDPYINNAKFDFRYEFAPAEDSFSFRLVATDPNGREYYLRDGQIVQDRTDPNHPIHIHTHLPNPGYHKWQDETKFVQKLCNLNWLVSHFGFKAVDGKITKVPIKDGSLDIFAESVRSTRIRSLLTEAKDIEMNPDTAYWEKIKLFADQDSRANLLNRWADADQGFKERQLMRLLMHNYPGPAETFIPLMSRVNPVTKSLYMPWGKNWIDGINKEFGTKLTADMFLENFGRCQEWNKQNGVKEDMRFIKQMKSNGKRGKQPKMFKGITEAVGSFKDLYRVLTDPTNETLYGNAYKKKSISGRRGRPVRGGTFIEFNMKKLPVMMVRGKKPFSLDVPTMRNCYAVVGMDSPKKEGMTLKKWINTLKSTFRGKMELLGNKIPYQCITPCSLEYWMDKINEDRRYFTDTEVLGMPTTRKHMFNRSTILQLRENGTYRFYVEGIEDDDNGWLPDPMLDDTFLFAIEDEFGVESLQDDEVNESMMAGRKKRMLTKTIDDYNLTHDNYRTRADARIQRIRNLRFM